MYRKLLAVLMAVATTLAVVPTQAQQSLPQGYTDNSRGFGLYTAAVYNQWKAVVVNGNLATGAQTIQVQYGQYALPDGSLINPFAITAPITIGIGANAETVTPTAVSACSLGAGNPLPSLCNITATFANTHGQGEPIFSGSSGLQEAINDAHAKGGGLVAVDRAFGGTSATIVAANVYPDVSIADTRTAQMTYWNPSQSTSALLAAPTALTGQAACDATHTFCSDATATGTWTAVAFFGCVAYVDIMGQEGPCSTTATFTAVAGKAIDVGTPAASAGAVGYVIYIGTSYLLASSVAITPSVCTMTTLETTTPACAVTNATYGQTGSTFAAGGLFTAGGAQIANITLVTSPGKLLATTASTTTAFIGTPNGRSAAYVYAPSSRVGIPGVPGVSLPFAITTGTLTAAPAVVATINLPPSYMNFLGRTLRVCGFASSTGTSTATIVGFQLWWEGAPSNASGPLPLLIGGPNAQPAVALSSAIDNYAFCQDFTTLTTGATGTLLPGFGIVNYGDTVTNIHAGVGSNVQVGAVGAPSLTSVGFPTHLHVVYQHTTGTDGAGMIAQKITVEAL